MRRRCYFFLCLVFSLWTIFQTAAHLVFSTFAYLISICHYSPAHKMTVFFYLTYLYNDHCKRPTIKATTGGVEYSIGVFLQAFSNSTAAEITDFVQQLLNGLFEFPPEANQYARTSSYILCILVFDILWITSAVALLMGTCFGVKRTLSLLFYGPYLVITALTALLDVLIAVQFGLDVNETKDFVEWRKFVGLSNTSFPALELNAPALLTMLPSLSVCAIGARFILIWITNLIGFVCVLKAAIYVFRQKSKSNLPTRNNNYYKSDDSQIVEFNSSEARIRNWQLFYGGGDEAQFSNQSGESGTSAPNRRESLMSHKSGIYHAYSDVAVGVLANDGFELRRHLPFSYLDNRQHDSNHEIGRNDRGTEPRSVRIIT